MPHLAPYGSWKSPITLDLIVGESVRLAEIVLDGETVYWLEGRPKEGGRNALVRLEPGGTPTDCLPAEFNVRTRVHEYGGGAYTVHQSVIYFVNFADQRLYRQIPGAAPEPLTPPAPYRYADLTLDSRHNRLLAVREDHTGGGEPVNTLVAIALDGSGAQTVLAAGHDFYAAPRLSPDGRHLAYLAWNHPNMPWDGTELWLATLDPQGRPVERRLLAGGPHESIFQPEWSPEGALHFVSDRSGWWNLYRWTENGAEALAPQLAEFGVPQWLFGLRTYAFLPDGDLVCAFTPGNGLWQLGRLDPHTGQLHPFDLPFTSYAWVRSAGERAVFLAASPTDPPGIRRLDMQSKQWETLRLAFALSLPETYFSHPKPLTLPTPDGAQTHAFFYPPTNPDFAAPPDERPPLLVLCHGGPTSASSATLNLTIQFWTSRGFAVADVNYGGSSGFGRAYRQRLNGAWGVVDVDDCCAVAQFLAAQGQVDGRRLAISGGSAGGFTVLAALTFRQVFTAGSSYYGIGDLEALAHETHKFESRYLDRLIGPYPAQRDLYRERSPLYHVERLQTPILLLQGAQDPVVPPNQAERMFEAVRSKGLPCALLLFEGEQHGFRRAASIRRALEAELTFYAHLFGFTPADALPPLLLGRREVVA